MLWAGPTTGSSALYYAEPHHLELLHLQVVLHQEAIDIPNANGAVQVWLLQKQLTLLD